MAWLFRLDENDLHDSDKISRLSEDEIKRLILVLDGDHFNRGQIMNILENCKKPRTKKAIKSAIYPVCIRIEDALCNGHFEFDLFREISGWFDTGASKLGQGKELEKIIRKLFYDQVFGRFTEHNNQQLMSNFKEIFLPWLINVFSA